MNHEILRDIASLCNRLPLVSHDDFKRNFMTVCVCVCVCGSGAG